MQERPHGSIAVVYDLDAGSEGRALTTLKLSGKIEIDSLPLVDKALEGVGAGLNSAISSPLVIEMKGLESIAPEVIDKLRKLAEDNNMRHEVTVRHIPDTIRAAVVKQYKDTFKFVEESVPSALNVTGINTPVLDEGRFTGNI